MFEYFITSDILGNTNEQGTSDKQKIQQGNESLARVPPDQNATL